MYPTPAQDAVHGSRDRFPAPPGREGSSSPLPSPDVRRERSENKMTGRGAAPLVHEPPGAGGPAPLPLTGGGP